MIPLELKKEESNVKIFNTVCYVGLYRVNAFDYGADNVTIETGFNFVLPCIIV